MNRPLLALAACLGCATLAIVVASAALLAETEGATVIERTHTEWVPFPYPVTITKPDLPEPIHVLWPTEIPDYAGTFDIGKRPPVDCYYLRAMYGDC